MNTGPRPRGVEPDPRPGGGVGALPMVVDNLSLVVSRTLGTVVVTVEGELGGAGCAPLEGLLTDLIEGQGNVAVAVDLGQAIVAPEALLVLLGAAREARARSARFILKEPPLDVREALRTVECAGLVELQSRRGFVA